MKAAYKIFENQTQKYMIYVHINMYISSSLYLLCETVFFVLFCFCCDEIPKIGRI